jgi:hypothetical protein
MKQRQLKLICALCAGSGWLCDEHPSLPWSHDDRCDGGGIACRCNELAATPHRVVFVESDAFDSGSR